MVGRFQHTIDQKGRIFVPSKLRAHLGETVIVAALFVDCVTVYPLPVWERFQEKLESLPYSETHDLLRQISSCADEVTVDSQGRILVPKHLLDHAHIDKDVMFIGAGSRAELWDPEAYEKRISKKLDVNTFRELGL